MLQTVILFAVGVLIGSVSYFYFNNEMPMQNEDYVRNNEVYVVQPQTCAICLESLRQRMNIKCQHGFHTTCLEKWFQASKSRSCPICRKEL